MLAARGQHQTRAAHFLAGHLQEGSLRRMAFQASSLEAADVLDGEGGRKQGILTGSLLSAPPAGIPEDIHVGRPEGETRLTQVVHGPRLHRDGAGHRAPERAIEGGGLEEHLREHGGRGDGAAAEVDAGPIGRKPVQGLGPPIIGRQAESGHFRRLVGEKRDLFPEVQPRDHVLGAEGDGEGGIAKGVAPVRRRAGETDARVGSIAQSKQK